MQDYSQFQPPFTPYEPPRRARRTWLWVLLGAGGLAVLLCGGGLAWVVYLGTCGPDTSVYTGNQVPQRFIDVMKSVGALDNDETILYFYSDALTDIREGFYFVSDQKVAVYSRNSSGPPLTAIRFDEIDDLQLHHSDSFFVDGEITLHLKAGRPVSFPVSGENNKDREFFEAIRRRVVENPDDN